MVYITLNEQNSQRLRWNIHHPVRYSRWSSTVGTFRCIKALNMSQHNFQWWYQNTWNFRLCEIIARSWNNTFFCCLVYFLLFSKNNAVSCLRFWLLGNACQPDLFLRFLDGKLRFLDGKLRRFKFLSAPFWEVQVPQNGPKPKNARRQKKMQVLQKSNNFWKSKNLTSFGRSRYRYYKIYTPEV